MHFLFLFFAEPSTYNHQSNLKIASKFKLQKFKKELEIEKNNKFTEEGIKDSEWVIASRLFVSLKTQFMFVCNSSGDNLEKTICSWVVS